MDRMIVYPGAIPLDTDLLSLNRNTMVALGNLVAATLGQSSVVDGLVCAPTAPASLTVNVGPGSITTLASVDTLAYGSLAADTADPLVKMGINVAPVSFALTPPATPGQAVTYLIQASFAESDGVPIVLPYYNAANPAQPFSGPGNSGNAQNTVRAQRVQLQIKEGAPASAGTQVTPSVDAGWIGLYAVTVDAGQTQVTAANIATLPGAPFVQFKLPQLAPGVSRMAVLAGTQTWTVPAGVTRVRLRLWGGGGAGGAGGGIAGGGGAGGGYTEGYFAVVPGQQIAVAIGAGGASGVNGGGGGNSTFGALATATGGGGGTAGGTSGAVGLGAGNAGTGSGGTLNVSGQVGQNGIALGGGQFLSGVGGGAFGGVPAFGTIASTGGNSGGLNGAMPGCAGSGGSVNGGGGSGASGTAIVEW